MTQQSRSSASHAKGSHKAMEQRRPRPARQATQRPDTDPAAVLKANKDKISFGDLPTELRDMVYHYALQTVHGQDIFLNNASVHAQWYVPGLELLEACRAIYNEGIAILYGHNNLRIDLLTSFSTWKTENGRIVRADSKTLGSGMNHPGLSEQLKKMPTRHSRHIRSLKFAFQVHDYRMKRIVGHHDKIAYKYPKLAHFVIRAEVRTKTRRGLTWSIVPGESRSAAPEIDADLIRRLEKQNSRLRVLTKSNILMLAYRVRSTCDAVLEDALVDHWLC